MNENELLERWGLCGRTGSTIDNRLTGDVGRFPVQFAVGSVFINNDCLQHAYNTHCNSHWLPNFLHNRKYGARVCKHASQHWTESFILERERVNCIGRVLKIIDVSTRLIYEPSDG
jgi:hypothetical protein